MRSASYKFISWLLGQVLVGAGAETCVQNVELPNFRRGVGDSQIDGHDGTIVHWEEGGLYYRYAMAYTECYMNSDPWWLSWFYRTINWFVRHHPGHSIGGFNCAEIAFPGANLLAYRKSCGFMTPESGQTVYVYSSTDMINWKRLREAFAEDTYLSYPDVMKDSILFRPYLIHNVQTNKYVMWVNRIPFKYVNKAGEKEDAFDIIDAYVHGKLIVATADHPAGPFRIADDDVVSFWTGIGDFGVVTSPDGLEAWIAYGSWDNGKELRQFSPWYAPWWTPSHKYHPGHKIGVEKLSSDFTGMDFSAGRAVLGNMDMEAPIMFSHGELYYMLISKICCFCSEGTNLELWVARDPADEWIFLDDINPLGSAGHVSTQQNTVTKFVDGHGKTQFLFTGDYWNSAKSGLKSYDFLFHDLLDFDSTANVTFADGTRVDVPVARQISWKDRVPVTLPCIRDDESKQESIDDIQQRASRRSANDEL